MKRNTNQLLLTPLKKKKTKEKKKNAPTNLASLLQEDLAGKTSVKPSCRSEKKAASNHFP